MGLLDGMLAGVAGAGLFAAVSKLVNDNGGLDGVVKTFQTKGLGGLVDSWVGTGENQPVTADQIHQALGADKVKELADHAGVKPEELTAQLSQNLPQIVDKLTPEGKLPTGEANTNPLAGGVDALKKLLG